MTDTVWIAYREEEVVEASDTFERLITRLPNEWEFAGKDMANDVLLYREPEGSMLYLRPMKFDIDHE